MSHVILKEWQYHYFIARGVLTALFGCSMAGATWNCCCLVANYVYTIQPCTSLQCYFKRSHIVRGHAYLAVTCHLHFWQNDRDLLRATTVTLWWNGYRNKSQHRKLTLEKKIFPPLLRRLEPATLRSWIRRPNHWANPAPLTLDRESPHSQCQQAMLGLTESSHSQCQQVMLGLIESSHSQCQQAMLGLI